MITRTVMFRLEDTGSTETRAGGGGGGREGDGEGRGRGGGMGREEIGGERAGVGAG